MNAVGTQTKERSALSQERRMKPGLSNGDRSSKASLRGRNQQGRDPSNQPAPRQAGNQITKTIMARLIERDAM